MRANFIQTVKIKKFLFEDFSNKKNIVLIENKNLQTKPMNLFFLKQFNFHNPQLEKEYNVFQKAANTEKIKLNYYFLIPLWIILATHGFINHNYLYAASAIGTGLIQIIIYFLKIIPRNYVQFLLTMSVYSFNVCMFFFWKDAFQTFSTGTTFFAGYAFASINYALLIQFINLKEKIIFLIYAFVFRVILLIYLKPLELDSLSLIRDIFIDLFAAYFFVFREIEVRIFFKTFYDSKEEAIRFKDLLSEYLPQSISVFKNLLEKPLFANEVFNNTFEQPKEEIYSQELDRNLCSKDDSNNQANPKAKLDIRYLKVEKDTIRKMGALPSSFEFSNQSLHLQDIVNQLIKHKFLNNQPICFSASYSLKNDSKLFEVVLSKIKWNGEVAYAVIISDITDQEKLISLKIADANKDQVIATVSHELRTPLNGIIGILGMVEKTVSDSKVTEYLSLCKDNAHLLLNLVNSILDLNQVRQGKLRLNPNRIDIKHTLSEVVRLFQFQCNNKDIFLKLDISPEVPSHVYTDENRLKQILINLISNSLKFTLKGGISIEIAEDPSDSHNLQVSVTDTGIGIKEDDLGKLFQMYEKIEHGRSINRNGVGLGLTISNTLACLLSGKTSREKAIEVESCIDEGSKFSFKILKDLNSQSNQEKQKKIDKSLECLEDSDIDIIDSPEGVNALDIPNLMSFPSREGYAFSKNNSFQVLTTPNNTSTNRLITKQIQTISSGNTKIPVSQFFMPRLENYNSFEEQIKNRNTILVVDDNAFNLLIVENMIKEIGYSFRAAKSGSDAIEIIKSYSKQSFPFKAILMDCEMPVMDGFETTRILRRMMDQTEISKTPIIALTAHNGEENIKKCYASGMIAHLSKPLFQNTLSKALKDLDQIYKI